jgi:hypothetical protein
MHAVRHEEVLLWGTLSLQTFENRPHRKVAGDFLLAEVVCRQR